jgi:hypothetical protein
MLVIRTALAPASHALRLTSAMMSSCWAGAPSTLSVATSRVLPVGLSCRICISLCTSQFAGAGEPSELSSESSLPTRVVITPIAFPMLNRGRVGATGVLSEAGIPPKRSGVRCNSVGVAVAEGFAGSAGWPAIVASSGGGCSVVAEAADGSVASGGASDGGVCADAAVAHLQTAQHKMMMFTSRRTTSVSAPTNRGQALYASLRAVGKQRRARHLRESLAFAEVSYKIAANRDGFRE